MSTVLVLTLGMLIGTKGEEYWLEMAKILAQGAIFGGIGLWISYDVREMELMRNKSNSDRREKLEQVHEADKIRRELAGRIRNTFENFKEYFTGQIYDPELRLEEPAVMSEIKGSFKFVVSEWIVLTGNKEIDKELFNLRQKLVDTKPNTKQPPDDEKDRELRQKWVIEATRTLEKMLGIITPEFSDPGL